VDLLLIFLTLSVGTAWITMDKKTYKNLSAYEELEFVLWLSFLEDSVKNAYVQMNRWNRKKEGWDLQMFFMALINIDDAIVGLKRFLNYGKDYVNESEFWNILKDFRKKVKGQGLNALRNDTMHREQVFQLKDKKGKLLPRTPILMLGGYNATTDEYIFNIHKIRILDSFLLVQDLRRNIRALFKRRLYESYTKDNYIGMIPYTCLHSFAVPSTRKIFRV